MSIFGNFILICLLCYLRVVFSWVRTPKLLCNLLRLSREDELPSWVHPSNEIVIERNTTQIYPSGVDSLFDYISADSDGESYSISDLTLEEVAESYNFSLDYLGDLVIQMGCRVPVDFNEKLKNFLTGDQIMTVLEAITTLDSLGTIFLSSLFF